MDCEYNIDAAFLRSGLFATNILLEFRFATGIDLIRALVYSTIRDYATKPLRAMMKSKSNWDNTVLGELIWLCDAIVSQRLDTGSETCLGRIIHQREDVTHAQANSGCCD